jgi:alpha-tubulin suppressor-like RCC1 family protein
MTSLFTQYIRRALAPVVLTMGAVLVSACGSNINEVANLPSGGTLTAVVSPARVVAGQIYTYQAAAPSGTTVTWRWGDGSPDTVGNTVQKVWNKPGNYTATLSATADGKLLSGTVTVTGEPLSAGAQHTCALQPTGTVLCWGNNSSGQLGGGQLDEGLDKSTAAAVAKATVNGLTDAIALSAGDFHTCAVKADRSVACWGNNNFGQLGNSSITLALSPTAVNGLTDAVAVSAGSYHTCALQSLGSVACWGNNSSGQLGNGTTTQSVSPVTVIGLTDAVAISTGNAHTCALKADRTMVCWGSNFRGQLGNDPNVNNTIGFQTTASQVIGLTDAVALSAGTYHTCAVKANGSAACWGSNSTGELGDGTTITRGSPAAVTGLTDAVSISAGGIGGGEGTYDLARTCALKADGSVACWGDKGFDNNGNAPIQNQLTPAIVAGLTNTAALSAGGQHNCALKTDGAIACWGDDFYGQLGDGSIGGIQTNLIAVTGLTDAKVVSASRVYHSCAVKTSGAVVCWGLNSSGQLGDGTTVSRTITATVTGLTDAVSVVTGDVHSCAIRASGSVVCWGNSNFAQLGDGNVTSPSQSIPVAVVGITDAVELTAGNSHTCARRAGGAVLCWGNNSQGQAGVAVGAIQSVPVAVAGLTDAVDISAGTFHTCARKIDDSVICWGNNASGQLGDGTTATRAITAPVAGLTDAVELSAGSAHNCARRTSGAVVCWGNNSNGQLGDGTTLTSTLAAAVAGLPDAIELSAGADHTCARKANGSVVCWGNNSNGQLGDGSTAPNQTFAVAVTGLTDAIQLAAGGTHSCAIRTNASVVCWGGNTLGQLGGNTTINTAIKPLPTAVLDGAIFWR